MCMVVAKNLALAESGSSARLDLVLNPLGQNEFGMPNLERCPP